MKYSRLFRPLQGLRLFLRPGLSLWLALGLFLGLAGCVKEQGPDPAPFAPPEPSIKGRYLETVRGRTIVARQPSIGEGAVRKWFSSVRFPGFRRQSLYSEFQPIDGNLLARYGDKQGRLLFVSFVDDKRKDPDYGIVRSAREMAESGGRGRAVARQAGELTWFGGDGSEPLVAVELNSDVKVVLFTMGDPDLEKLFALALGLDMGRLTRELER